MKFEIKEYNGTRQAIIDSGILDWIEKNVVLEKENGMRVGVFYALTHNEAQDLIEESEFPTHAINILNDNH